MLDPDRPKPPKTSCYVNGETSAKTCQNHVGIVRHPTSWDEVEEYLDAGAVVMDNDGDQVFKVERSGGDQRGYSIAKESGLNYSHYFWQMLIEDVSLVQPATPEEEDEAIASILNSIK